MRDPLSLPFQTPVTQAIYMVDVNQLNVSRSNQKIEEAELNVVSASGLFSTIFF